MSHRGAPASLRGALPSERAWRASIEDRLSRLEHREEPIAEITPIWLPIGTAAQILQCGKEWMRKLAIRHDLGRTAGRRREIDPSRFHAFLAVHRPDRLPALRALMRRVEAR